METMRCCGDSGFSDIRRQRGQSTVMFLLPWKLIC